MNQIKKSCNKRSELSSEPDEVMDHGSTTEIFTDRLNAIALKRSSDRF